MTKFLDQLKYHLLVWLPAKKQGNMEKADFICPQAFGRNTWTDKEVPAEMLNLKTKLGNPLVNFQDEAILELRKLGFDPGSVNVSLAKGCYTLAQQMQKCGKKPWIIGQWEVIFALVTENEEMTAWYKANRSYVIAIWPPDSNEYLGTKGLLIEANEFALKNGLIYPIIVGHRMHLARCARLAKKVFTNICISEILLPMRHEKQFDPCSKQHQTCGLLPWLLYEILARIHHAIHRWT